MKNVLPLLLSFTIILPMHYVLAQEYESEEMQQITMQKLAEQMAQIRGNLTQINDDLSELKDISDTLTEVNETLSNYKECLVCKNKVQQEQPQTSYFTVAIISLASGSAGAATTIILILFIKKFEEHPILCRIKSSFQKIRVWMSERI